MVSVEDSSLRGGGYNLKQKIWNAARDIISEWTGEELTQCSLYGIRIYREGSILASHVDRLPLVSSAIINVAQDVDEPWPLEVIGHDGKAANITMEPGDMVLYESHSTIHGRPFPLKGRFYANVCKWRTDACNAAQYFESRCLNAQHSHPLLVTVIHFEPTGHSLRHNAKEEANKKDVDKKYRESLERGVGGHENDNQGLPSYIIPGTPEESHWRKTHPQGSGKKQNSFTTGSTPAHEAAQQGNTEELARHIREKKHLVNARDSNGWTPLMER